MRIVLDTNVLVSALLNTSGVPASILDAILDGTVTILVDDRILHEYRDVLFRPKFSFPKETVSALLDYFEHHGEYVVAGPAAASIPDPDDVPFFDVAVAGEADFLVTGNHSHFPKKSWIVSARGLADALRKGP